MPSLFERVGRSLTRKKSEVITTNKDESRVTAGFEPVSTNDTKGYVSPSETNSSTKKSGGVFQTFLRARSPSRAETSRYDRAPHLSLHLPDLSDGGGNIGEKLSISFEQPTDPKFSDDVLAARRLTTAETISLVRKTASVITQRGLETPGIFKPYWYAQSLQEQRKLLVCFLQTLPDSEGVSIPSTEPEKQLQPSRAFDAQLAAASPHDVAEVFKWAIRHFKLEGASFGISKAEYGWYQEFAEAERAANYPPRSYTTILAPLLPPSNLELLNVIFNFGSSVASYAEINGVSGSKLTRTIGWWLLSQRQQSSNGLVGFIQSWETAARILEHLFLAYIRDQQQSGLMPRRLTQLVKSYPYLLQAVPTDQYFLPRPKFSTQQRIVLFLRVGVVPNAKDAYAGKPLQLLKDAIGAQFDEDSGNAEYRLIWEEIKHQTLENFTTSNSPTSSVERTSVTPIVSVSRLLTETSVRTLTTASGESTLTSPVVPFQSVLPTSVISPSRKTTDGGFSTTNSTAITSLVDWDDFTGSGFGTSSAETGLTFSDFGPPLPKSTSATMPTNARSTISKSKQSRRATRRRSVNFKRRLSPIGNGQPSTLSAEKEHATKDDSAIQYKSMEGTLDLDEAFIEGWGEIPLDKTVGGPWPSFALYELRTPFTLPSTTAITRTEDAEAPTTRIHWLAIETYVCRAPADKAGGGQQFALDRYPSTSSLSRSYAPRSRSNSVSSMGSRRSRGTTATGGTGNSDEKSESGDQPDWFEVSQIPKHWKTGASILRRLKQVRPSSHRSPVRVDISLIPLSKAIGSLSSATEEMNLNAKAWSAIETTLSRHVRGLKSFPPSHDISSSIQEYIKVFKHILALWARTVDPSIHLPYDALAPHQKTKRFSLDRHELSLFTRDYETESMDEEALYKQNARLEEAFTAIGDGGLHLHSSVAPKDK